MGLDLRFFVYAFAYFPRQILGVDEVTLIDVLT